MTNDSTDAQRRFLVDLLNDAQDLKRALGRSGPGDRDAFDNLIDAFNRRLLGAAAHGVMCGIDALDVEYREYSPPDYRVSPTVVCREITPPLYQVIAKLEAALERLK